MRPIRLQVQQQQPRSDFPFQSAGLSLLRQNPSARAQDVESGQQGIAGQIIVPDGLQDQKLSDCYDAGDTEMPSAPPLSAIEVSSRSEVRMFNVERARIEENPFWRREHVCPLSLSLLHVLSKHQIGTYGAFSPKSNIPLADQTGRSNVDLRRRSSLQAKVEKERLKRCTAVCIQSEDILLQHSVQGEHAPASEDRCEAQTLASATDSARAQARMGAGRNRVLLKGMWNGIRVVVAQDRRDGGRARAVFDYVGMHPHILTCHCQARTCLGTRSWAGE
eukprot:3102193-Rhodomonas_salina.1